MYIVLGINNEIVGLSPTIPAGATVHELTADEEQLIRSGLKVEYVNGAVQAVANALDLLKARQKARIAAARYKAEFGGFSDAGTGMIVRTDNRTRTLLTAAAVRAASDPSYQVPNWKTSDGTFITLTNSMILALDQSVRDFIAAQFAKEAALCAQIDAATTNEEMEAISW